MSEHVIRIQHSNCHQWIIDSDKVKHISNRYFSIVCLRYSNNEQIMINQPEIGILGFIITRNSNNRKWLIQNKPEPGNMSYYQYAPTVQSTKSNYERVHGGKSTPYLNFFINQDYELLVDVMGSEQGDRFLNKFNRNCKYLTNDTTNIRENSSYFWLTTEELKMKLACNYAINTDARSVIATGHWNLLTNNYKNIFLNSALSKKISNSFNKSYHLVEERKFDKVNILLHGVQQSFPTKFKIIPFSRMREHKFTSEGIIRNNNQSVVSFFDVKFNEREVTSWQQPLVERQSKEYCVLVFSIVNDIAFFYVEAYPEVGFIDRVELGPSFQTGKGELKTSSQDLNNNLSNIEIITQIDQSDEGGRFYRNITRYSIGHWMQDPEKLSRVNGIWLTAGELEKLSLIKGMMTNELRTLLSLLLSFA